MVKLLQLYKWLTGVQYLHVSDILQLLASTYVCNSQAYIYISIDRLNAYMRCTQIGGLKVASSYVFNIFPEGITEEYQYKFCEDILGESYSRAALTRAVEELNFVYGGQDQIVTHVIFSNAALNPLIHFGIAEYDRIYSDVVFLSCKFSWSRVNIILLINDRASISR